MSFFKKLKNLVSRKKEDDVVVEAIKESHQLSTEEKYEKGLEKSRNTFTEKVKLLFVKNREIDENFFKELEELLIMSDVGADYTFKLTKYLRDQIKLKNLKDKNDIVDLIIEKIHEIYLEGTNSNTSLNIERGTLNVILVIGVNGVGKTTSIAKLANQLKKENWKVSLAAADTFRAGAVAQLQEWSNRVGIDITIPEKEGQDPASVVYKAITRAKENNDEVLLIDTAGRLQNKQNLMKELEKIHKVILSQANLTPAETLLVLDATVGQNGVLQASAFNELIKLTGIILTKMDSSSKGGIILSVKDMFDIPVKYIGLGESLDDLEPFNIDSYLFELTKNLMDDNEQQSN